MIPGLVTTLVALLSIVSSDVWTPETPHIINGHLCMQQRQQLNWLLITMEAPGIVCYCSEDCIIGSRPVVFCIHQTQSQTARPWSQYRLSSPLGTVLFLEAWWWWWWETFVLCCNSRAARMITSRQVKNIWLMFCKESWQKIIINNKNISNFSQGCAAVGCSCLWLVRRINENILVLDLHPGLCWGAHCSVSPGQARTPAPAWAA